VGCHRHVKPVALKARFVFRLIVLCLTFLVLWGCMGNKLLGLNIPLVGLVECSDYSHLDLFPCICTVALGKHLVDFIGGLFTYLEVVLFPSQVRV